MSKVKSPLLALILLFLISGLGQIYNGHTQKGLILLISYLGLAIFSNILQFFFKLGFILVPFLLIIWLFSMFDAYNSAYNMNKGVPVKEGISAFNNG